VLLVLVLSVGCNFNIFDNDEKIDELGWKKTSMPSNLKGIWKTNNVQFIELTSKKIILDNREWILMSVYKKDDEIRLEGQSGIQHKAYYCKNIHDDTMELSIGEIEFSSYDSKMAPRDEWIELSK